MRFLLKILLTAVIVVITAYILPGIHIDDFVAAIIVAFILAILNGLLKPLLIILTIPVTIITFGLFLFVIDAVIILIAGSFVSGFFVDGFWWALLFSLIMSFFSSMFGLKD